MKNSSNKMLYVNDNSEEIVIDSYGKGKYGRVLAEVWCDGINLNEQLLANGHAYEYDGGKKKEFK